VGGWGCGAWAQPPTPKSPIPNPQSPFKIQLNKIFYLKLFNIIKKIFINLNKK
jgi:hypothetical protein